MAFGGGIDDRPVLDQSHDAKHNRREDRSEHPVGNQSETGKRSVFGPVFHGTRGADGVRCGAHAESLRDGAFHSPDLQHAEAGDRSE